VAQGHPSDRTEAAVNDKAQRVAVAEGIERLVEWAAATPAGAIPREVTARAVRVLADDLSAMIGARDEPEVKAFHEKVLAAVRDAEATVFRGGRRRAERIQAAVANAVAADWLELDEGYRVTPCHAGLYVLPALLAEAEVRNLKLEQLLRALVLGYEVVTRVARAFAQRNATMQSHGRFAAVGAAAAIALARNKPAAETVGAISAAATLIGPAPRNHLAQGILVRNVWPAAGAWSGMMAVEWAECGITGTPGAFFDVYGTVLGSEIDASRLTERLGESWAILDGYTKIYACCQHLHSAVEAALDVRKQLEGKPLDEVRAITVETHPLAMPLVNPAPHTTLAAKFSMSHAMAAALAMGSGGADAFAATTLADPRLAKLRERVSVRPWAELPPPPNDRPARVRVAFADGSALEATCLSAQGGPDRPLPPETVLEKMSALASPVYPRMRAVFEELVALPGARLAQGWADIVTEICS
jgi:2-methylcitrate dehydratase PrpD